MKTDAQISPPSLHLERLPTICNRSPTAYFCREWVEWPLADAFVAFRACLKWSAVLTGACGRQICDQPANTLLLSELLAIRNSVSCRILATALPYFFLFIFWQSIELGLVSVSKAQWGLRLTHNVLDKLTRQNSRLNDHLPTPPFVCLCSKTFFISTIQIEMHPGYLYYHSSAPCVQKMTIWIIRVAVVYPRNICDFAVLHSSGWK